MSTVNMSPKYLSDQLFKEIILEREEWTATVQGTFPSVLAAHDRDKYCGSKVRDV